MDYRDEVPSPADFANELFVRNNEEFINRYVTFRIKGHSSAASLRMAFGEDYMDSRATARIYALEGNPEYQKIFNSKLEKTKISELWNPKIAVHELVSLVRDKFEKGSVRLGAAKELNVLCEITIVDETGKTKAGRKLEDFYAEEASDEPAKGELLSEGQTHGPTTH